MFTSIELQDILPKYYKKKHDNPSVTPEPSEVENDAALISNFFASKKRSPGVSSINGPTYRTKYSSIELQRTKRQIPWTPWYQLAISVCSTNNANTSDVKFSNGFIEFLLKFLFREELFGSVSLAKPDGTGFERQYPSIEFINQTDSNPVSNGARQYQVWKSQDAFAEQQPADHKWEDVRRFRCLSEKGDPVYYRGFGD